MSKKLRVLIPVLIMLVIGVGFTLNSGVGTLSALGWGDISLLCPLGALTTMLASKTIVPRAVISLIIAVIGIILLGRAFCGWICPVPVISKLRYAFSKNPKQDKKDEQLDAANNADDTATDAVATAELTDEEKAALKSCAGSCSSCAEKRAALDSRHLILGGSLLSAAIFGFPVFCLICPIGLTFATILLVILLFSNGDVTWTVVFVPVLLAVEVIFFRKWCSKLCPLGALMSLLSKANRTFRPTVDNTKCLETTKHANCGKCVEACPQGIDPRNPEAGERMEECIKCRACVEACPVHAVSMPLVPKKASTVSAKQVAENTQTPDSE